MLFISHEALYRCQSGLDVPTGGSIAAAGGVAVAARASFVAPPLRRRWFRHGRQPLEEPVTGSWLRRGRQPLEEPVTGSGAAVPGDGNSRQTGGRLNDDGVHEEAAFPPGARHFEHREIDRDGRLPVRDGKLPHVVLLPAAADAADLQVADRCGLHRRPAVRALPASVGVEGEGDGLRPAEDSAFVVVPAQPPRQCVSARLEMARGGSSEL